jgi:exopolyphosphatase / guanosine-5'-triphosphate,3'-diphosphate pyrophosphatase
MRVGSIDIGTNTILLLVADVSPDGQVSTLLDVQAIGRLGRGVDREKNIRQDAFARCRDIILDHLRSTEEWKPDVVIATGTSALRDARNRAEFISHILESTGLDIEVLSGDEEARLTYSGAISGLRTGDAACAVLDIGGGSTELSTGKGLVLHSHRSIDIGAVRLTEKHLSHSPPTGNEIEDLFAHIRGEIAGYPEMPDIVMFVGVAGTVTTLAAIELGLRKYDARAIAGYELSIDRIEARFNRFKQMTPAELESAMSIDPGRSDIILAGIAILLSVMKRFSIPEVVVSERGLRYGVAIREARRHRAHGDSLHA